MSRFTVISLIAFLLSACQAVKNPVMVEAVSPHIYCQGQIAWSAEATKDNITDYTTFWIAFEQALVQENFNYVNVEVTLDGKPVYGMKYIQSPEPYHVTCTDGGQQFESSRVKYTLLLPPLSTGEHTIVWKYTLTADLSNDLFDYPTGMIGEVTGVLEVLQ
ncbi:MAG TPA: hypothetical protein VN843_28335 [Anaerolineales bacterium]|nr:hypothetical protein [Anaerolineales bacterium]